MKIETAIQVINESLIFRPTWKFTASDNGKRFENSVKVRVDYDALETNRDQAMQGYPLANRPYAEFAFFVEHDDTLTDLAAKLLEIIACIDSHEAREFLRFQPTGWAPFHPHHIDGIRRWSDRKGTPTTLDLQFGIA